MRAFRSPIASRMLGSYELIDVAIGTPAYMAPEAILGNSGPDRRVDIYGVGCVAYCLDKNPDNRPTAEELLQMTGDGETMPVWNANAARKWWTSRLRAAAVACLLMVAVPAFAQAPARATAPQPPAATAADLSRSLETTAQAVSPSVVEIFTTAFMPREGIVPRTSDLIATERASGSGVIIDSDGYIITNAHVVNGVLRGWIARRPRSGFRRAHAARRSQHEHW